MRTPATSVKSLIAIGRPARRLVFFTLFAAARARSKQSVGRALTAPSTALIRASAASSNSRGETLPDLTSLTACVAVTL